MARKFKFGYAVATKINTLDKNKIYSILADAIAHCPDGEEVFKIKWNGKDLNTAELIN